MPPQRVARLPVARDRVGLPQPRVGKAQARGQTLNRIGLAVVEVEVPQFGLAVPAGQGERPGHRLPVVVLSMSARACSSESA